MKLIASKSHLPLFACCFLLLCISNLQIHAQFITDLKITEIMYNPPDEPPVLGSELEFIEMKNTGSGVLDLSNVAFVGGVVFSFPFGASINPGANIVLVSNQTEFANKYPGITFYGQYVGLLANTGERIKVAFGSDTIISFRYNDNVPWPVLADGNGYSAVPINTNPTGLQESGSEWRASTNIGGSPGQDDPSPPVYPIVLVNELLSNPQSPDVDAVELHNPGGSPIDISGWFLSDNRNNLKKFKIPPSTNISANGYLVYDAADLNVGANPFLFNQSGDNVYLTAADAAENYTGYVHGWSFNAQYPGISFGIYQTSENKLHFVAQSSITLGTANDLPMSFQIAITKIMYNPLSGEEEFIEIKNISGLTVNLWSPDFQDTTWTVSGMGFRFPPAADIMAGETIVICDIDPASFRAKYDLPATQQVFQFTGNLRNEGERITLRATGLTDTSNMGVPYVPYIDIDVVEYDDKLPWPIDADGDGAYLLRSDFQAYGNDPINWTAQFGDPFVGINDLENASRIRIYPNPVNALLFIEIQSSIQKESTVRLLNNTGQVLLRKVFYSGNTSISTASLPKGFYLVEVRSSGNLIGIGRIIK